LKGFARASSVVFVVSVTPIMACSSIPNYIYEDDGADGATAADGAASDAAAGDAAADRGLPSDAGGDTSTTDTCPARPPPYATTCCGTVPCAGECATQCGECQAACGGGEACCAKKNNVICRPRDGFICN